VDGGQQAQPGQHLRAPGKALILGKRGKDALGRTLLKFLHEAAGVRGRFRLDAQVKMVRHEGPADKQKAHLDAKLPEDFDKGPAEPITLKKLGAATSAAGEELQLSVRKRAFGDRHDER